MYFSLNVWIIPRSRGWSLYVQFVGKNTILMWSYLPFISGGWQGALSRNKMIFLRSRANFRLSLDSTSSRRLKSIQALSWLKYEQGSSDVSLIVLKQRGFFRLDDKNRFFFNARCINKKMRTLFFLWIFSLQYTALIPRLEICLEVLEKIDPSRPCWRCFLGSSRSRYSVSALAKMLQFPP